ncbi:hypothetical protein [Rickettsia endosymbiont of Ixodes pacificus]|uniref:hypothetical protein n=1 Tax=Rickettsia endosymbiont of Ixodes pacificus TaxID=1133329 RepID=UPI0012E0B9CF|nr:hypothetical protein [Rickettsia endosymbiont of Ixodes pacificus]
MDQFHLCHPRGLTTGVTEVKLIHATMLCEERSDVSTLLSLPRLLRQNFQYL